MGEAKWIKGKYMTVPPKKRSERKNGYMPSFFYCTNCTSEAYWDTDYGQQLFEYCPYCGFHMTVQHTSTPVESIQEDK